jgi:hypothetical protein
VAQYDASTFGANGFKMLGKRLQLPDLAHADSASNQALVASWIDAGVQTGAPAQS